MRNTQYRANYFYENLKSVQRMILDKAPRSYSFDTRLPQSIGLPQLFMLIGIGWRLRWTKAEDSD